MQLYAGLDMHTSTTTGTIKDEQGNPVRVLKVPTSEEGMKRLFDRMSKNKIKAVFEASRNWPRYARLIKPHCTEVVMAHPLKVKAIASARIKTDTIDSNILSDLLRANLIPESYMPQLQIVKLRELLRYRAILSRKRASFKIKVREILSREGKTCEFTDVTTKRARLWINAIEMDELNRHELDVFIHFIDEMTNEIKLLDKRIEQEQFTYPETELLKSIIGIDTYSAMLIIAEVGDFMRFETPDKLASYAGLVSSTYQSSNSCYNGKITRQGSKWLRWILVQCVHAAIKSRTSHKLKRFYARIAKRRGKKKAVIATARKMLTIIWHLIDKNQCYAG